MSALKEVEPLIEAYKRCIKRLNGLQSGYQTLERHRKEKIRARKSSVDVIRRNLPRIGYSLADVDSLNIIHVAGTKGKGSVCAYTESIIRAHGKKTGFFTSPHLREVRDRIRICGQPISKSLFVKYFSEVWDKLSVDRDHELGYFQFLTLLSYHVYKQEGVDACIYETGIGGECDATNIVSKPVVTGITKLGIDHPKTLQDGPGPGRALSSLIENIAWHKGGILKAGSPAFSTVQEPKALKVLQDRASEKGISLEIVGINPELNNVESILDSEVQKFNASLAVALANTYLMGTSQVVGSHNQVSDLITLGIKQCKWEGRFQSFENGLCKWHLDGAHNIDSIKVAAEWFVTKMSSRSPSQPRILIFNQQSEQRDGDALLKSLFEYFTSHGLRVDYAIFTTSIVWKDGTVIEDLTDNNKDPDVINNLKLQWHYADLWKSFSPNAEVIVTSTVEEALSSAEKIGNERGGMEALITGSLHLVGSALYVIDRM